MVVVAVVGCLAFATIAARERGEAILRPEGCFVELRGVKATEWPSRQRLRLYRLSAPFETVRRSVEAQAPGCSPGLTRIRAPGMALIRFQTTDGATRIEVLQGSIRDLTTAADHFAYMIDPTAPGTSVFVADFYQVPWWKRLLRRYGISV